jgi:ankyrin repeat protein
VVAHQNHIDIFACAAALGHLDVMKAVVEVLQSSAADVAGCQGCENIKEPSINMLTWGRFVKDVMNARTSAGKTPLMLACEKGYATALKLVVKSLTRHGIHDSLSVLAYVQVHLQLRVHIQLEH